MIWLALRGGCHGASRHRVNGWQSTERKLHEDFCRRRDGSAWHAARTPAGCRWPRGGRHDPQASKRAGIRAMGATPVVADALDRDQVGAIAATAPEVIVHELTALAGSLDVRHFDRSFALTNRLRTEGTDHLLAAARATGVRRFVAQSFGGWPFARSGGAAKTEEDPLDPACARHLTRSATWRARSPAPIGCRAWYCATGDSSTGRVRRSDPAASSWRRCEPASFRWWATAAGCGPLCISSAARAGSTTSSTTTRRQWLCGFPPQRRRSGPDRRAACLHGRSRVARTLLAWGRQGARIEGAVVRGVEVNGQLGALLLDGNGGLISVMALDISDGQVRGVNSIVNPDKLRHVGPAADLGAVLKKR